MQKYTLLIAFCGFCLLASAQVHVNHLLCEHLTNPLGVDASTPRLSWEMIEEGRGIAQTAYEVRVGREASALKKGHGITWETGKVTSDESVYVTYGGPALSSGAAYSWQVRVWDQSGKISPWSDVATWRMGMLHPADWTAQWIVPGYVEDSVLRPSPLLRSRFPVEKSVRSAIACITAHGLYEAHLNGQRVGDGCLTPGWTSYNKRLPYQQYDVTALLQPGNNVIAVALGSGWYRGHLAWGEKSNNKYGRTVGLLFQLTITYTDGSMTTVQSDGHWKSSTGNIVSSEIYAGETIDDRLEKKGWMLPDYDDAHWSGVSVENEGFNNLVATVNEPIRPHETFKPARIFRTPNGEQVVDFGQNLVGWVAIRATGKSGDSITLHHAEVLDKKGNFYTENLRGAAEKDVYILNGVGEEHFEPHFTFQGFRYVKVEGYPGTLQPEDVTAVALYSDMVKTGSFTCSDPLINQLQHNIQWGQRGNFLDVPTDCPQRDERLGWTGDAEVFSRTASYNMNVDNFFAKWLRDVAADQFADGGVPHVVPNVLGPSDGASAGWADVSTIIPWNMYLAYGDKQILAQQYSSMKAWVEYMHHHSVKNLWNTGDHFGDWLYFIAGDDEDGYTTVTNKYFIAQCFYAHSIQLLLNTAVVLNKTDDVTSYTGLLADVKKAFMDEYVTPNGRLTSPSQTGYVLALNFDMLPEALRPITAQRLVESIDHYQNHLTTGFLGTPYLCHVLTRYGHTDVAYKLLLQDTYPSWLYPVKMGATTIWERWDGIKPDSSFEDAGMNSFNHYAYGAIGDWMYRVVAGIDEAEPGYKKIVIKPHMGEGLTHVKASYDTYFGTIVSEWTKGVPTTFQVRIPANTRATVYIPAPSVSAVTESGVSLASVKDLTIKNSEEGYVVVEVGSGTYQFSVAP